MSTVADRKLAPTFDMFRLWDLDAINFEDTFINLPPTEMLSVARLAAYRDKLKEALTKIDEHFPKAKKLYRTLQTTKVDRGDW